MLSVAESAPAAAAALPPSSAFARREVEHLHLAVLCQLDIGRLEIAVNDSLVVGRFERLRNLVRDAQRFDERERTAAETLGQLLALDQLHDERTASSGFFEAVNARDVRVTERRQYLRFPVKARHPLGVVREVLGQELQRHFAVQARVGGTEHFAHAASPELAGDAVVRDGFADHKCHDCTPTAELDPLQTACLVRRQHRTKQHVRAVHDVSWPGKFPGRMADPADTWHENHPDRRKPRDRLRVVTRAARQQACRKSELARGVGHHLAQARIRLRRHVHLDR